MGSRTGVDMALVTSSESHVQEPFAESLRDHVDMLAVMDIAGVKLLVASLAC